MDKYCNVKNRSASVVVYKIPEDGIRRSFAPGETKKISFEELEKLTYQSYNSYYDGYKLIVNDKYLVPIIESGIVVFLGDIDNYGYTIIIEGIDGVDIWYANIENTSLKLYDYVKKGSYLGETKNNNLYLVFEKNQEFLKFEDYIKN